MKFKIEKTAPLFDKLLELFVEGQRCNDKAEGYLVRTTKGPRRFGSPDRVLFGGIAIVQLPYKRNGWKLVDAKRSLYRPVGQNAKEIAKLPVVTKDRLRKLLNYGHYPSAKGINTVPSVTMGEDYCVIAIPEHVRGYEPVDGMVEILGSEYIPLYDKALEYSQGNK